MPSAPETRESLIIRLRKADDNAAWEEFVAVYRPVIVRLAMSRGLQHSDADDLAQQVLVSVVRKIPEWQSDDRRAQFRTWLSKVVRNAAINMLTRRRDDRGHGGTSALILINGEPADGCTDEHVLELEWRREAFRRASDQIRDEFQAATWEAFWLTAVEGVSAADAAQQTGKSVGAVYVARSRIMARLQQKLRVMSGEFDEVQK